MPRIASGFGGSARMAVVVDGLVAAPLLEHHAGGEQPHRHLLVGPALLAREGQRIPRLELHLVGGALLREREQSREQAAEHAARSHRGFLREGLLRHRPGIERQRPHQHLGTILARQPLQARRAIGIGHQQAHAIGHAGVERAGHPGGPGLVVGHARGREHGDELPEHRVMPGQRGQRAHEGRGGVGDLVRLEAPIGRLPGLAQLVVARGVLAGQRFLERARIGDGLLERRIEDDEGVAADAAGGVGGGRMPLHLEEGVEQAPAAVRHLPQQQALVGLVDERLPVLQQLGEPALHRIDGHGHPFFSSSGRFPSR